MYPVVSPLILQFVSHAEWPYRQAGLLALRQVTEGCKKEFTPVLNQVGPLVVKFFADPHERVRGAAITATAQCCSDFSPDFQTEFIATLAPVITKAMADPCPRVASLAAKSVVNFLEGLAVETSGPYLDALVTALLQLLQGTSQRFVREDVVEALSGIADHTQSHFLKYYDTLFPWFKGALAQGQVLRYDCGRCPISRPLLPSSNAPKLCQIETG